MTGSIQPSAGPEPSGSKQAGNTCRKKNRHRNSGVQNTAQGTNSAAAQPKVQSSEAHYADAEQENRKQLVEKTDPVH
ncbi:hypothetical protein [Mesorhizobium sp. ZC-5]|uniref:hypothetical protein n=1 Tax=Mesorhizobium sp. ZC-5 TaxID=2986066 RepID=UPI0021E93045|nr:hypothetical protein [Mesorhizobium sp. ZC-5]MCV3239973.1 hypothetical protein [Mesorhizobium sp. ZC-5]